MAEWVRLKKGNDWHSEYWCLEPLNQYGSAEAKRGLALRNGEVVNIRWPDGTIEERPLIVGRKHVEYSDMGHTCWCDSQTAEFEVSHNGVTRRVGLEDVDVLGTWVAGKKTRGEVPWI